MTGYLILIMFIGLPITVAAIAYARFKRIGSDMSAFEFFRRLIRCSTTRDIRPAQLETWLENGHAVHLADLRDARRYQQDHIMGSISDPFDDFLKHAVVEERFQKEGKIVLICDTGHMSRVATDLLAEDEGFSQVYNLKGGMAAWQKHVARKGCSCADVRLLHRLTTCCQEEVPGGTK